jgi:hypothetical protein
MLFGCYLPAEVACKKHLPSMPACSLVATSPTKHCVHHQAGGQAPSIFHTLPSGRSYWTYTLQTSSRNSRSRPGNAAPLPGSTLNGAFAPVLLTHFVQILPPEAYPDIPTSSLTTRFVASTQNKTRCPVFCATFAPDSRRLLTGDSSGGISVWNALDFGYMQYLQVRRACVLAVKFGCEPADAYVWLLRNTSTWQRHFLSSCSPCNGPDAIQHVTSVQHPAAVLHTLVVTITAVHSAARRAKHLVV